VELDLSTYKDQVPIEVFGQTDFPRIGELPYLLTLGPHGFHWFSLSDREHGRERIELAGEEPPRIEAASLRALLTGRARSGLEARLPAFLLRQRWFRSKTRSLSGVRIVDAVPLRGGATDTGLWLAFAQVDFETGTPETYVLPLAFHAGEAPWTATLARVRLGEAEGRLDEASDDPRLGEALRDLVARRRSVGGGKLEVAGVPGGREGRRLLRDAVDRPQLLGREQTNTTFRFGDRLVGKLLRRLDDGASPEVEIASYLTEVARFPHSPPLAGHVALRRGRNEPATLAVFHGLVPNEGDAWAYTLDALEQLLEAVLVEGQEADPAPQTSLLARARAGVDPAEGAEFAFYLDLARLLGRRTGELHRALAAGEGPAFAPERSTPFTRRSYYQSLRNLSARSLDALEAAAPRLDAGAELARAVLDRREAIRGRLGEVIDRPGGVRTRIHGDYHLGQVLFTGRDFQIIDFEGEPARSLAERRHKRSPLVDVAGMLRSFHYAAEMTLRSEAYASLQPESAGRLRPWASHWRETVSAAFLGSWLDEVGPARLLPESDEDLEALLHVHLLEKALYELAYELDNRPAWVDIPLRGVLDVLGPEPPTS
jgi:maltose alpha-D-glucosyltransferase/alpha-amylase